MFVRLALTATAHSSRNDSTNPVTGLGPIGVHEGQHNAIGYANGDNPPFAVVSPRVNALQRGSVEDLRRELEIEASLAQVPTTLPRVPPEAHGESIRLYIQPCNVGSG